MKIKPKPEGLDKPYVGKIIKAMSKVNVAVYRWTGGLLGSKWRVGSAFPWGIPVLLLWYENLRAHPECEVQIKRRKMKMTARTASSEERAELWPKLVAHYPDFASYETWTERVIPVVILEPRA